MSEEEIKENEWYEIDSSYEYNSLSSQRLFQILLEESGYRVTEKNRLLLVDLALKIIWRRVQQHFGTPFAEELCDGAFAPESLEDILLEILQVGEQLGMSDILKLAGQYIEKIEYDFEAAFGERIPRSASWKEEV